MRNRITNVETNVLDTGYTWGLVLQGVIKKKKRRKKKTPEDEGDNSETESEKNWWTCMREEVAASARFPTIDQPVAEALCVLADLDTWHVGILSNNAPWQSPPLPVGMSRLVSNMLESFAYVWRKYHSPTYVSLALVVLIINNSIINAALYRTQHFSARKCRKSLKFGCQFLYFSFSVRDDVFGTSSKRCFSA